MVKPSLRLFVRDESKGCTEDFLKRCGGKLFGVYIFDENLHVHCAEVTPSFEMEFLYFEPARFPEDDSNRDELHDELAECGYGMPGPCYVHVFSGERLKKCKKLRKISDEDWQELVDEHGEEAHRKYMEKEIEHYNANTPY